MSDDGAKAKESPALERALFLFAFAVYAATRFIGLTKFPIYFFCDEATQANLADDLFRNGFHDSFGVFLPPYFLNDTRWDLSLSVYLHVLPVALFGKSVAVTRGTEVVVNLLAPVAIALALKKVFRARVWWAAPLVLAAIPTWFLHSRTAFQPAMTASFYAGFLAAYLLYRCRSPRWIFAALLFGGATFYSYTAGQGLMFVTGILLLVSDWRYHFAQPGRRIAAALLLALLLAVPYVRYRFLHPNAVSDQLRVLNSYWIQSIPTGAKLATFARNYVRGFHPAYWFAPEPSDLERHRMKGMGHLPVWLVPFLVIGLVTCLRRWRSPPHRVALISPIGVPFSAAAASIGIMRVLAIVVPFTLFVCLGLEEVFAAVRRRRRELALATAAVLGGWSVFVLWSALVAGPTWYSDYGLYGMQYGARQLFGAVRERLLASPDVTIVVSPTWSNYPETFLGYFLTEPERQRVSMANIEPWIRQKKELGPRVVFVMTPPEYEMARLSRKFVLQSPERVLDWPDGRPGFYFVRLRYADNIDELLEADAERRRRLDTRTVKVGGEDVLVRHSRIDLGRLEDAFDGNRETYLRGAEANPFVIELEFPRSRDVSGIGLDLGTMEFRLRIELTPAGGGRPIVYTGDFRGLPPDPHLDLDLPRGAHRVDRLRLEMFKFHSGITAQVHLRDLALR